MNPLDQVLDFFPELRSVNEIKEIQLEDAPLEDLISKALQDTLAEEEFGGVDVFPDHTQIKFRDVI